MARKVTIAIMALVAVLAFNTGVASASPNGQCGGEAKTVNQFYKNLKKEGVVSESAKVFRKAGYTARDGSVKNWMTNNVFRLPLAKAATISNNGCRSGNLFGAGSKRLRKGVQVFVTLPVKYSKEDVSSRPKRGYVKLQVRANFVGQSSCSNPGSKKVIVNIWVKKTKVSLPPPVVTTPHPPGPGCVVIVNGDNNGNAGCGNWQVCTANGNYSGDPTVCAAYMSCIAIQGNTWNSTQNVCVTPPPPPPPTCEQTHTCPPPPNTPPMVSIYNPAQHVCSGTLVNGGMTIPGQVTFIITASDPDGDNLGTPTVTALRGTVGLPTKIADGQWTVRYTAPITDGTDKVTATVSDGKATASGSTPVFANPLVDLDNPSTTTC